MWKVGRSIKNSEIVVVLAATAFIIVRRIFQRNCQIGRVPECFKMSDSAFLAVSVLKIITKFLVLPSLNGKTRCFCCIWIDRLCVSSVSCAVLFNWHWSLCIDHIVSYQIVS